MNSYLILPLAVTGLCLMLMVLVLRRDHRSFNHRIFAFFLLSMATWGSLIFGMRNSPDLEYAFAWERGVLIAILVTGILYYHFTLNYTRIKPARFMPAAAYLFGFVVIILSPTDLFIKGMQIKPYGYAPILGPAFMFYFAGAYLIAVLGFVNLVRGYRASRIPEERNRYLYLGTGAALSIFGAAFDVAPVLGLPAYPGAIIGNMAFGVLASVAIVRYHLLDVNIIVRRGAAYVLMSAIVALPYAGLILLLYSLFQQAIPFWGSLILLLVLALGLQPAWRWVQGTVDRAFFQERYDFLRELENFSQETHNITDLTQITSPLVRLLSRGLQASSVHLLLASESGDFGVASAVGSAGTGLTLASHSPLVAWFRSHHTMLRHEDLEVFQQLQNLTEKEREQLSAMGAEIFFPLKTKTDELVGILVLGQKLSRGPYSSQDEGLVFTVASRMAVELENALLYARERAMREELQKQNQQKTEFLHGVAHELKTPLTAIISSSELLGDDLGLPENTPRQRLVSNISHSAWSMDKRITELLDFARLQIGTLRINLKEVDVPPAIAEIASVLEVLFKNKDQTLKVEVPEDLPQMRADRDRFEQVMVNLLSNANKFSPNGTMIALRARNDIFRIVIEVEDSAAPLSEKERARLFEPYYRGEDADKRQRLPGLGLGLAISKRLVEMQGGELSVRTEKGKGNIFAFSVPAVTPEAVAVQDSGYEGLDS